MTPRTDRPPAKAVKATKATRATKATKATSGGRTAKAVHATKATEVTKATRATKAARGKPADPKGAAVEVVPPSVDEPLITPVVEDTRREEGAPPPERPWRSRAIVVGVLCGGVFALLAANLLRDDATSDSATPAAELRSGTTITDASEVTAPVAPAGAEAAADDADPTTATTAAKTASAGSTKTASTTVRAATVTPPALAPPETGRYPIKVVSSGTQTTGTLVITADGWQRRELGKAGDARTEQLSWSDAGARLVASGDPGADGACRWEGRSTSVPRDLKDGRTWSSRVTCASEVNDQPVTVVRVEKAAVTKRARTQLADRSLDTWVIERRISLTIKAQDFTTTSESISTELFAPGLGLAVYSTSRTDVPLPDGSTRPVYASEEVLGLPSVH